MNQLKNNSKHILDTPDIHIDNTGDNNDNVNHSMTAIDGQSVMPTQDEHRGTATDGYTMDQVRNLILQSKEYNPVGRLMIT